MAAISQFSDFNDGVLVGKRLIQLSKELGYDLSKHPAAKPKQIEEVVAYLRRFTPDKRAYPAIEGFLSTILRQEETDVGIMTILGADNFIAYQREAAPLANFVDDAPFVQFAYWSGQADGDAWVFDFVHDVVRCLSVDAPRESLQEACAYSYGVFPHIEHFVAFLRCDAEMNEWLSPLEADE